MSHTQSAGIIWTPAQTWRNKIRFYERLNARPDFDVTHMVTLTRNLAQIYSGLPLYAQTSSFNLYISNSYYSYSHDKLITIGDQTLVKEGTVSVDPTFYRAKDATAKHGVIMVLNGYEVSYSAESAAAFSYSVESAAAITRQCSRLEVQAVVQQLVSYLIADPAPEV